MFAFYLALNFVPELPTTRYMPHFGIRNEVRVSPVILNLDAALVKGTANKAPDGLPDPAATADAFGTLLAAKLQTAPAKAVQPSLPAVALSATKLEAKIEKLLVSGASQTEIVAKLAAGLAATVAAKLGDSSAHARQQLQAVFARALAPPADGGGAQSIAESARALAQRFRKIEKLADAVAAADPGQLNQLAGTFLDAGSAKETPVPAQVPNATGTDRSSAAHRRESGAQAAAAPAADAAASAEIPAVHAFAPAVETASTAIPVPAIAAPAPVAASAALTGLPAEAPASKPGAVANVPTQITAGDGRRVTIDPASAVAGNGDTVLGRVLTRAALAADARQAVSFAVATAARSSANSTGSAKPQLGDAAVAAFVKAFEAAVTPVGDGAPAAAAAVPPAPAFAPAVAPFRIEPVMPAAAGAGAAHTPAADSTAIADQVLRGIAMRSTGASSEMRLSLKPESLGDVNVKLTVTAGNVTAHVIADTPEVRDALVAAQPQLTKSLADAGLKLDALTVDLSGNGFAGFSQHDNDRAHRDGEQAAAVARAAHDNDSDDATLDAIPSFAPSTSGAGDYNYLA